MSQINSLEQTEDAIPLVGLADRLKILPPHWKRTIVVATDIVTIVAAFAVALFLRIGEVVFNPALLLANLAAVLCVPVTLWVFGLYNAIFRHVGPQTARRLGEAVLSFTLPWAFIITTIGITGIPRTLGLLFPIVLWMMLFGARQVGQWALKRSDADRRGGPVARALIYGAGSAGRQLAAAISQSGEMIPVGFVDDDTLLQGRKLDNRPIVSPTQLGQLIERLDVTHVLLALPKISRKERNEIIGLLRPFPVQVKTLPGLMQIAQGHVDASDLRDLDIEDLLGRDRVDPNHERMRRFVADRVVLVSGAGGSIGSELCRQLMALHPRTLLLVERSEVALYNIHRKLAAELAGSGQRMELVALLASVTDEARMDAILTAWSTNLVFHAAAYKHVPLVEANPVEGLRNNVFGTLTLAKAAIRHGCNHFVLVSTDKAVRPTNVMGATKRLAEMVLQTLAQEGGSTILTMVRFGNVLGSSGSVVPLFRQQIAAGGPLTVTHREMTRYFMLISEAAQLVVQAGQMARGGEVFLLEMGAPVKIWNLAESMIQLAGARPYSGPDENGDIEIREVGLRPGEKLYEELLIDESAQLTEHPLILSGDEPVIEAERLWPAIATLSAAVARQDTREVLDVLNALVPEFARGGLVDAVLSAGEGYEAKTEDKTEPVRAEHRMADSPEL